MSNLPSPIPQPMLLKILTLLTTLGIPASGIAIFNHFFVLHPLFSIIICLIYEMLIFLIGFLAKIWQKLESRWADRITDAFDQWTMYIFHNYRKQYLRYIEYQYRDFDVKGLTIQGPFALELNQVFIELRIDPATLQQVSTNPVQAPQNIMNERNSIWHYLASPSLQKQNFVVTGPPGSGKTTLLKNIALSQLKRIKTQVEKDYGLPTKFPILLLFLDHANDIHNYNKNKRSEFTIVEALHDQLKQWEQSMPPKGWIKKQLEKGQCIIMLDGLDEVADSQIRKDVASWTQKQVIAYPKNRFIVTSRPFGLRSNPLSSVTVLEVRPFTFQQVKLFVNKWYLADEIMRKQKEDEGVRMKSKVEAKDLLHQLSNSPALLDLTVNPLLLTMITIVHRYGGGGKLPQKRISLYEDICKVFLGKRQEARGQNILLKPDQVQMLLQPMAYYMMKKGMREITPEEVKKVIQPNLERMDETLSSEDFLKLVENVSGLLIEREIGVYSFAHKTFQEFLAAKYIKEQKLGADLITKIEDIWWQETIRLYCAMSDATPIISACLENNKSTVLKMAIDCQKDALELSSNIKKRLEIILKERIEDKNPDNQHVSAEFLLEKRTDQMIQIRENTFIDTSFVTNGEYQLFLDEQCIKGIDLRLDHWKTERFLPGQANNPVFGIRPSDAEKFCVWLTERSSSHWHFRLPKEKDVKDDILKILPTDKGFWLNRNNERREFKWTIRKLFLSDDFTMDEFSKIKIRSYDNSQDHISVHVRDYFITHASFLNLDNIEYYPHFKNEIESALENSNFSERIIKLVNEHVKKVDKYFNQIYSRTLFSLHDQDIDILLDSTYDLAQIFWNYFNKYDSDDTYYHEIGDNFFGIYMEIVLLKLRIKNKLPTVEGILLVKDL